VENLVKSQKTTPTSTSGEKSNVVLGFDAPIPFEKLSKGKRHSNAKQRAWQRLTQAIAGLKAPHTPNIKRLKPGAHGAIDLGELGPGDGAWVTPHRGPAAGRHVLVVMRPNGDFALIGGMHSPATRIDKSSGEEYLVGDDGKDLVDEHGGSRKITPEDYLSHISHRHFAFKQRQKTTAQSEEEQARQAEYAVHAEKKRVAQKEYKGARKVSKKLVKTHADKLDETLGLAEGTTLSKEAEEKIVESFENAALGLLKKNKIPLNEDTKRLVSEFAKRATRNFRRERAKKIEQVQEIALNAARKGREGKSTDSDIAKLRQISSKIKISAAPIEEPFMQSLQDMQNGDMFDADNNLDLAADQLISAAFDHASQQAMEEVEQPADDNEPGNLNSPQENQDILDLIDKDPDAVVVDPGLNLAKTISKFKSGKEREKKERKIKEKVMVPQYAQVDAEPEFENELDQRAFFDQVATDQRQYAAARVAADRARDYIKQISEEAARQGVEERPRTAVSPEEFATTFQDIESAMASTGVTEDDIRKEMKLLEEAQNITSPSGPGMYTVINEFWNSKSGNLLDPYMRQGSEYALSGMLSEHLPPEILATEEVQGLLGKISTKVKFNDKAQRFEMITGKGEQGQYGGLVHRTSASVAPIIVARKLAQLAQRGEAEKARIHDLEKKIKDPEITRREQKEMMNEINKLKESPFSQHWGRKDFDRMNRSVDTWNRNKILQVEDRAMEEDSILRSRIEQEEKQITTGEIIRPEDKIGVPDINPRSRLASMLQKTESLESLRRRRQVNLGMALGSLETVATLNVALREAIAKAQWKAVGVSKIPEEGEIGEEFKFVSSPTVSERNDIRIDIPGPVDDPDPDKRDLLRNATKISAYDYVKNQLGLSDSEIHEVEGTAMAVPRGKLAVVGVDKNGAHVRVKLGGPSTQEEVEAETTGRRRRARGLMDKIPRVAAQQASEDRYADIKYNKTLPTREDHPPLLRETLRTPRKQLDGSMETLPMEMRLAQFNAFNFMKQPKLFDDKGKPVRGSKGGLNTMTTGAGKTMAAFASIADNHNEREHMNYVISIPGGMTQQWVNEANEMTDFHTVGLFKKEAGEEEAKQKAKTNEFTQSLEVALEAQKSEKHPTPIVIGVPNGSEMAKGYGIKGWGKEQQHEFFKKMHDMISKTGAVEGRNIVFVMEHEVDSNIHSVLTKTHLGWGHKYAPEYLGKPKAEVGDIVDHLSRLGVRGRIVDEPQKLLSTGETSNKSNAGKRIFKNPMEYRQLLTATPARRALVEAYDAIRWVARTPVFEGNDYARGKPKVSKTGKTTKGSVVYHDVPGLPKNRDVFMSVMGGLGRGTFTHDHIMKKQAQQQFANWNIGDEQRERHYKQTTHDHKVARTDSQVARQIEIEKDAKGVVERELAAEAKKLGISVDKLRDKQRLIAGGAMARALGYSKEEHRQNIDGTGVVREGKEVTRRSKDEVGGVRRLPRTDPSKWQHNAKINAMIEQVKKHVDADPEHKIVVVADSPDQVAAIKAALEDVVYKPTMGIDPVTGKKTGRKVSVVSTLGATTTGKTKQERKGTSSQEIDQRKADFLSGKIRALIIDKDNIAGHNLQTANSIHMMSYLKGDASDLMQAQGRSDRPERPVRSDKEVSKEIIGAVRSEGESSKKVRVAIFKALNEAHADNPDRFPENLDVKKLPDKEIRDILSAFRKYNKNKWQRLALGIGIFTEAPLEVHNYHLTDSPQELQEYDLVRQGNTTNEVTTPAMMTEPFGREKVEHAPTGEEQSRIKMKSLYLRSDLVKAIDSDPLLIVRN